MKGHRLLMLPDRSAIYLIPYDVDLPEGETELSTISGESLHVDATCIERYQVTSEEAKVWLKSELTDVVDELKGQFSSYVQQKLPSRKESPAELLEHADAIDTVASWLSNISSRAEWKLRAKAQELRERSRLGSDEGSAKSKY